MNRKILLALCIPLVSTAMVWSDDGSWSSSSCIAEGALYIEGEHPFIELEKEVLIFEGFDTERTEALFLFRNTSGKTEIVEAGFPIQVEIDLIPDEERGRYYLGRGMYEEGGSSFDVADAAFGNFLHEDTALVEEDCWDMKPYYIEMDELSGRRRIDRTDFIDIFDFTILLDGKEIFWDYVVVETEIDRAEYSAAARIVFHFHHVLQFRPSSVSEVSVSYSSKKTTG